MSDDWKIEERARAEAGLPATIAARHVLDPTAPVGSRDDDIAVFSGRSWRTPVTDLAGDSAGEARAERAYYLRGYYRMHGVLGREYYEVADAPLRLTRLFMGDQEWMIDDPLHWHGMRERVDDLPPGRVLVAGLGLGLMLHHMVERRDLTEIVVVERERDVIDLVSPTLPRDPRVMVLLDDYYSFVRSSPSFRPDSVLWDLAVGEKEQTGPQLGVGRAMTEYFLPGVPMFAFGVVGRGPLR